MIIKMRSQSPPGLIIQGLDNQAFHLDSPNFSNSADDSPDQTVDRTNIEYHDVRCLIFDVCSESKMAIGEDFHSQVGDDKVKITLYKVR